jgi:regulatory protein YycH of two-component signal transduction system YycFG
VKFLISISLPFLCLSCANLASDRWSEKDKEEELKSSPTKDIKTMETARISPELLSAGETDDTLQLVDPDTTSELMKDENKKTVSVPTPLEVTARGTDSAIEIKPSSPASAEE